jgi:hypothetical protein
MFMLVPTRSGYQESVLHRFAGGHMDGAHPQAALNVTQGDRVALTGTTQAGGLGYCLGGCGVVFRHSAYGERLVYRFEGRTSGAYPESNAIVVYPTGDIVGTTYASGPRDTRYFKTIYHLALDHDQYTFSKLYSFGSVLPDGEYPEGTLTLDGSGNLVGTTVGGGTGHGTVFRLVR